jgi:hypothetical protein
MAKAVEASIETIVPVNCKAIVRMNPILFVSLQTNSKLKTQNSKLTRSNGAQHITSFQTIEWGVGISSVYLASPEA